MNTEVNTYTLHSIVVKENCAISCLFAIEHPCRICDYYCILTVFFFLIMPLNPLFIHSMLALSLQNIVMLPVSYENCY